MIKFEIGKIYSNNYITDSTLYDHYQIVKRTAKTVWFKKPDGNEIKRAKIHVYNEIEMFYPDGKYSMCMIMKADKCDKYGKEDIKKLAKEMDVSINDLMCLARGVVNSIEKDGIKDNFLNETKENREEIAVAYSINECKKFDQFATTYSINKEARDTFNKQILFSL